MISPKISDEKRRTILNYAIKFKHKSFEEERERIEREDYFYNLYKSNFIERRGRTLDAYNIVKIIEKIRARRRYIKPLCNYLAINRG